MSLQPPVSPCNPGFPVFKKTVARDLLPLFFYISKVPTLDPDSYHKFSSNLVSNSWSSFNLSLTPRYIMQRVVKSLRYIMQRGVKFLNCILQRRVKSKIFTEILPLHVAVGRCDSLLHLAVGPPTAKCSKK
jgi:hypothetical protein